MQLAITQIICGLGLIALAMAVTVQNQKINALQIHIEKLEKKKC